MTITLSAEQQAVVDDVLANPSQNYIITGEAGTGKSTVIATIKKTIACALCATTARAALIIGGTTVDKLFGFERDTYTIRDERQLEKRMLELPNTIIIDEASMVGFKMADVIYTVASTYGKRIILVLDLAQAAPVKDEWAITSALFATCRVHKLTEGHRQSDVQFLSALNSLRRGTLTDEAQALFSSLVSSNEAPDDWVRLSATNAEADKYNATRYSQLETAGGESRLMLTYHDDRSEYIRNRYPLSSTAVQQAYDSSRLAHDVWIKPGIRVLMTVNHIDNDYVNGDTGELVDAAYTSGGHTFCLSDSDQSQVSATALQYVIIKLDRTGEMIEVSRTEQTVRDGQGRKQFTLVGFPFRYGWAITIHKSQGMTLEKVQVDILSILKFPLEGRHGLAYVALSRAKSPQGLRLKGWDDAVVFCSPVVKDYV